jgi:hypothetical protein
MDRRIRIIPRRIPHRGWFFKTTELVVLFVVLFKTRDAFLRVGEDNKLGAMPDFIGWGMIRYVHQVTTKIAKVIQERSAGMMGEKERIMDSGI